jgi:hypothetical protein
MGVQTVHEHGQAPQIPGVMQHHAHCGLLLVHMSPLFIVAAAAAAAAAPPPPFCCTAPSPGRRRDKDEGRNAVAGGPVLAAGAGAGARAGGGLNGSTLMVAPQHELVLESVQTHGV